MAEEFQEQDGGQDVPEGKQLTEVEQRAASQGWVPQDEWEGDADAWRPAKEFLDRGELFKKIDEQNRTIKEFKKTLDQFAKHHANVKKVEYERALADLKKEKREALAEGDADALIEVDEKIALVREAQREPVPQVEVDSVNPVFTAWVERNGWYQTDDVMQAYADRIGNRLGAQGGYSPSEILVEVEKAVKEKFADKFRNPKRSAPSAVEGGGAKGGKAKDTFSLSEEERKVANNFIRSIPGYTMEMYVAELKKVKGVS